MRVIQRACPAGERVIALGTFDGVHRGHQSLLRSAKGLARELGVPLRVCTFNRHPLEVLRPDDPPDLLSTIPEKARRLLLSGADEMELLPFDRETAGMEPESFLEMLRNNTGVRALVAGWNYSFGRMGRGNAELLQADGAKNGYRVLIEPPVTLPDGTAVSSSLIRQKLKEGKPESAAELLGYPYTLAGSVATGKQEGRRLGYPTANIEPWKRKALPRYGVYTALLETETDLYAAVVNIGVQPTLPSGRVTVEAHVLGDNPELYGQKVRLTLRSMLREEKRFRSPEELRRQIERDRLKALRAFGMA